MWSLGRSHLFIVNKGPRSHEILMFVSTKMPYNSLMTKNLMYFLFSVDGGLTPSRPGMPKYHTASRKLILELDQTSPADLISGSPRIAQMHY